MARARWVRERAARDRNKLVTCDPSINERAILMSEYSATRRLMTMMIGIDERASGAQNGWVLWGDHISEA